MRSVRGHYCMASANAVYICSIDFRLSAINFAYRARSHLPDIELTCYEKNNGLTGTCKQPPVLSPFVSTYAPNTFTQGSRINTQAALAISQVTHTNSHGHYTQTGRSSESINHSHSELSCSREVPTTATPLRTKSKPTWRRWLTITTSETSSSSDTR